MDTSEEERFVRRLLDAVVLAKRAIEEAHCACNNATSFTSKTRKICVRIVEWAKYATARAQEVHLQAQVIWDRTAEAVEKSRLVSSCYGKR